MLSIRVGMAKIKGTSRVVWMGDDEIKILQTTSDNVDLPQTQVLSRIVSAGLKAIASTGNRLDLPLKFNVVKTEDSARWQETESKPKVR
jgi:hypothetical protein